MSAVLLREDGTTRTSGGDGMRLPVERFEPATIGVAPCGATYGTAAGPNDGVTPCGACHVVHPVDGDGGTRRAEEAS
jgi:hypothetical protein